MSSLNLPYSLFELYRLMRDAGYVEVELGNKHILTTKFFEDSGKEADLTIFQKQELIATPGYSLVVSNGTNPAKWEQSFIKLISDAKVPARLEDGRGGVYSANKFSVDGLKVFRKALENGVNYDILVKSVMLYYKSSTKYKKAIGNYFTQGDWRTDYEALANSASEGIESLEKHIKGEIEDGSTSGNYKF